MNIRKLIEEAKEQAKREAQDEQRRREAKRAEWDRVQDWREHNQAVEDEQRERGMFS